MSIRARDLMAENVSKSNVLKILTEQESCMLKSILKIMLVDIQRACAMNDINFCLCFGSALGACRHKGFIPWDDDLDISMKRSDWNKFKSIFEKELSSKYEMEAPNYGDKDTKTLWGKIYLKGSLMTELQDLNGPFCKGIFIDVFVLDYLPQNKILRKIDSCCITLFKGIATSQIYYKYPSEKMKDFMSVTFKSNFYYKMRRFLGFCFSWVSHKRWCSFVDNFVSRHGESDLLTIVYYPRLQSVSELYPFSKGEFEGVDVMLPHDIKSYLAHYYGENYMQLPPVEKRERHYYCELDFGTFK
ncbi:MAG: LicD family protein [Paludibacteraceae bacterium]|nr:LicD family protein [Paludibacteraceae bacterium]